MRVGVIGSEAQVTSRSLARAWRAAGIDALVVTPEEASRLLDAGDVAVGRLDVLPTLDGVEPGIHVLDLLSKRGVRVLNPGAALLAAHDKLETADLLRRAHVPHPQTFHVRTAHEPVPLAPPLVVKPRFGSWGRDVFLCRDASELDECLADVWARRWFRRDGALVQALVPPRFHDVRVIVGGGRIVGAARRRAATGEWRTNVSLGGELSPVELDRTARALALAAAAAVGMDLVGVDLLPLEGDAYTVIELNGAAEFDGRYALPGGDVYLDAAAGLGLRGSSVGGDVRHVSA
ncbi:MAG TPA: ATP-grasp domain-containing protein [Gaiellaceae bacterium]|nr:ATP-grasp domain-containing protein [Gaiellaceae bacterium]